VSNPLLFADEVRDSGGEENGEISGDPVKANLSSRVHSCFDAHPMSQANCWRSVVESRHAAHLVFEFIPIGVISGRCARRASKSNAALCSSPTETLAGEDAGDSDALPTLSTSTDSFSCAAELALRLAFPARRLTVILEQQRSITESKTGI